MRRGVRDSKRAARSGGTEGEGAGVGVAKRRRAGKRKGRRELMLQVARGEEQDTRGMLVSPQLCLSPLCLNPERIVCANDVEALGRSGG